jgi:hypothetical protein
MPVTSFFSWREFSYQNAGYDLRRATIREQPNFRSF